MSSAEADNSSRRAEETDAVLHEVYDELRRLARHHLAGERADHTLQPTALVHEAYLRLSDQQQVPWENRRQFIALASTAIRRILVDYARAKRTAKRSATPHDPHTPPCEPGPDTQAMWNEDLAALDEALDRLAAVHARSARVVELRHFGGLSIEETAQTLGVSGATVERDWRFARAWLKHELSRREEGSA